MSQSKNDHLYLIIITILLLASGGSIFLLLDKKNDAEEENKKFKGLIDDLKDNSKKLQSNNRSLNEDLDNKEIEMHDLKLNHLKEKREIFLEEFNILNDFKKRCDRKASFRLKLYAVLFFSSFIIASLFTLSFFSINLGYIGIIPIVSASTFWLYPTLNGKKFNANSYINKMIEKLQQHYYTYYTKKEKFNMDRYSKLKYRIEEIDMELVKQGYKMTIPFS